MDTLTADILANHYATYLRKIGAGRHALIDPFDPVDSLADACVEMANDAFHVVLERDSRMITDTVLALIVMLSSDPGPPTGQMSIPPVVAASPSRLVAWLDAVFAPLEATLDPNGYDVIDNESCVVGEIVYTGNPFVRFVGDGHPVA
jgi:hypothetical protein